MALISNDLHTIRKKKGLCYMCSLVTKRSIQENNNNNNDDNNNNNNNNNDNDNNNNNKLYFLSALYL